MQLDLRGKRCLIFGGNSGSGRCFELELASEDSTFTHTAAWKEPRPGACRYPALGEPANRPSATADARRNH